MNIARLIWRLDIECPRCKEEFDLCDQDHENTIAKSIFTNQWDDLTGHEVFCTFCKHDFVIDEVEQ
jgi:hypothetical protein